MTKVIISGGGTGGHIFPAIAIANALKSMISDVEILFIGAAGKMEMEKVPAAGYKIVGLPVSGFQRRITLKNLAFPFRLIKSLIKARSVITGFSPDIVIGVGGYASGPTLRIATSKGVPTLIQEQNSFPGVTNRILSAKVNKICVAYEGMQQFFPPEKIVMTGNPIRQNIVGESISREDAVRFFNLDPTKKTLLVVGGSLGARTINEAVAAFIATPSLTNSPAAKNLQVIWQTGKLYYDQIKSQITHPGIPVVISPFIERMDLAYSAADIIVSRAGAIAMSELCVVGKPAILVPSPNVTEDHQTKNAKALESRNAAILLPDRDAVAGLGKTILDLLNDQPRMETLMTNISALAIRDAANRIAKEAISLIKKSIPANSAPAAAVIFPRSVYFLGIGGIGMSALARYFKANRSAIAGYDRTRTAITDQLEKEGMIIHFEEDISRIPSNPDLIIYTPAIPADHRELTWFRQQNKTLRKRAEVLGDISRRYKTIAVAGTHGKTTTSTMIAHILQTANIPFLAFLGGISRNYGTNYITNMSDHSTSNIYCVVEADEYDKSFLQLQPDIAIITSADADHLDIYGNFNDLLDTFSAFTGKIREDGSLIIRNGLSVEPLFHHKYSVFGYMVNGEATYAARHIRLADGLLIFDFHYPGGIIEDITLNVPGMFNLENAVAALASAARIGVDHASMKKALATYEGVKRRFEYIIRRPGLVYIDDYAHHPEELRACITAARDLYPDRRITGVFQPHLFTRTRDLADGFAESLSLLDEVILMEIYPAREKPIEGVTSAMLLEKINLSCKKISGKEILVKEIAALKPEILLTMGAGDIDQFVEPIRVMLTNSENG